MANESVPKWQGGVPYLLWHVLKTCSCVDIMDWGKVHFLLKKPSFSKFVHKIRIDKTNLQVDQLWISHNWNNSQVSLKVAAHKTINFFHHIWWIEFVPLVNSNFTIWDATSLASLVLKIPILLIALQMN